MTEKESASMAKQLTYCYSANTKAAVPLCLCFTRSTGEVGEALLKSSPGYKNWAVRHEEGSYLDALAGAATGVPHRRLRARAHGVQAE